FANMSGANRTGSPLVSRPRARTRAIRRHLPRRLKPLTAGARRVVPIFDQQRRHVMFSLTRRLIIGATLGLLALAATPAQAQRFIPPRVLAGYLRLQMTPPFMLSPLYRPAITPAEIAMTADALRFRNIYPDDPAIS